MWMRAGRWVAAMSFASFLCLAAPPPSSWVPVRWPFADTRSLELLAGTPINCLLFQSPTPELVAAAQSRGAVALAVIAPGGNGGELDRALAAKVDGIVLEGEFPEGTAAGIAAKNKAISIIELTSRSRLALGSAAPVLGTYQGVWPGITVDEEGAKKSGPTSSVWIDTNTGFLRAVRAWGNPTVWIANRPPAKTAVATHAIPASHRRRRHLRRAMGGRTRRRSGRPAVGARRSRRGDLETDRRPAGLLRAAPRMARDARREANSPWCRTPERAACFPAASWT